MGEEGCLQWQVFRESPAFLLSFWVSERPNSPFAPLWEKGAKGIRTPQIPLRPFVGEGGRGEEGAKAHQDAPTPPSPRVGEGGWGDEGQMDTGTSLPLSALSSPHAGQGDALDEETL